MGHRPGTSVSTAARVCVWFVAGVNSVYLGFDKAGWLQQYKIPRTPQQAVSPELFRTCLPRRLCPLHPEQMQHVGGSQSLHVLPGAGAVWPLPRAPLSRHLAGSTGLCLCTAQVPHCGEPPSTVWWSSVPRLQRCSSSCSALVRGGGRHPTAFLVGGKVCPPPLQSTNVIAMCACAFTLWVVLQGRTCLRRCPPWCTPS